MPEHCIASGAHLDEELTWMTHETAMQRLRSVALWSLFLAGCGEARKPDEVVPISQVPAALLEAAKRALPDYKLEIAYKIKVNGKDAYEIRGKNPQGKVREVEIGTDGKVIEVE
jgi:hypothetical protein